MNSSTQQKVTALALCVASALSAQIPLGKSVVAIVDGKEITRDDVDKIREGAPPALQAALKTNPASALLNWYLVQYLGNLGEERKLHEQSPMKERIQALIREMLAQETVNNEGNSYVPSQADIQAYLDKHRAQYEQSHIRAIYISFKPEIAPTGTTAADLEATAKLALAGGKRGEAEARSMATTVLAKLRAGEDFGKLVEQYSDDAGSKANGGDFGIIKSTSSFPPDFKAAVLALEQGAISEPIRQPAGYYVIRVEEKGPRPLVDVSPEISQELRDEHTTAWLVGLQKRFTPQVKDPTYFAVPGLEGIQQSIEQSIKSQNNK